MKKIKPYLILCILIITSCSMRLDTDEIEVDLGPSLVEDIAEYYGVNSELFILNQFDLVREQGNKYSGLLETKYANGIQVFDIELIYEKLGKIKKYFFIIFIDDLSFEKIDSDYKIIKSTLDGSIQNQPKNIILYVTSNRRHLMPRDMIENERSSAIHTDESVEEKISLSDRFGLWIGFHNLSQDDFIEIIKKYCEVYNLEFNDNIKKISIRWSLQRGNRTGRSAWQFILNYAAEQNKKISF